MRHYFPSQKSQTKQELISIETMRKDFRHVVQGKSDEEMEILREKLYKLAYFLYYEWIDSLEQ